VHGRVECPLDDGGIDYLSEAGTALTACGPVTIPAGTYACAFTWDGRNWYGPSDTERPRGAPFPPGDYVLTITTAPGYLSGSTSSAQASATLTIRITP
jgi:hypothetical protein